MVYENPLTGFAFQSIANSSLPLKSQKIKHFYSFLKKPTSPPKLLQPPPQTFEGFSSCCSVTLRSVDRIKETDELNQIGVCSILVLAEFCTKNVFLWHVFNNNT